MRVLGLDSSGMVASVAVVEDDTLLAEYTVNYQKTHSQTLLPMLDTITKILELDISTIDAIAVAAGPGSFTGLRIGSATAKGLGLALQKPLVSVPTTAALAYNLFGATDFLCPIMDARRNQVYTGIYRVEQEELRTVWEQRAVDISELTDMLNCLGGPVIFLGDGVPVFRERLEELLQISYRLAPAHVNRQRAGAVAALGLSYVRKGKIETAAAHKPEYLRMSQAERERKERKACKRKAEESREKP